MTTPQPQQMTIYVVVERDTRVFGWAYLNADRAAEVAAEQTTDDQVWVIEQVVTGRPLPDPPPAPGTG